MTLRRFYAPVTAFEADNHSVSLTAEEARHLRDVLRLKNGDEAYVFDGAGREFQCAVTEVARDLVRLKILREVEAARPESPLRLVVAVALLKSDKFDLVVQKVTELGAVSIVPVATERADIRLRDDSDANKRVARWQRIALEAAKQSGRALVPEVLKPTPFNSFVQTKEPLNRFLFSEREGRSLGEVGTELTEKPSAIAALIGPEGGWSDGELSLARESGWSIITLGGRTLRAETAAIMVTGLLQHLFGDLI